MNSLADALRGCAARFPGHSAIVTPQQRMDFARFDALSDLAAAALAGKGVEKGDRIGLYCINSPEFAVAYAGIVKAGATVVPINLLLAPGEIAFILNDAGAKGLIYHGDFEDFAEKVRQSVASLGFRVRIGGESAAATAWEAFLDTGAAVPSPAIEPDEDLAAILYTSGTTGRPKGAMLTHRNLLANTRSVSEALQWRPGEEVVLLVLPMFHAFAATVGMLTPLTTGCAFVPLSRFDPDLIARSAEAFRATVFLGVPSMYSLLLKLQPERVAQFKSLRCCVSGGAALPTEILERFESLFGKPIYEGDGPTECSPVTCVNPVGGRIKPGTVGLPVPSVEMKIVNGEGEELPVGTVGEIAVRGPNVMKGYWNLPEETAQVFAGEWFLTGDLGMVDEEGYFSIVDRKKDLIIVNGMNVYPRVIEEVLYRHPAIQEAAVVGEPHTLHGEIPVAYVSLREGKNLAGEAIRSWCKEHLGRHEVPRQIHILPRLPKNATGKILKRQLRKGGERERGVAADFLREGE